MERIKIAGVMVEISPVKGGAINYKVDSADLQSVGASLGKQIVEHIQGLVQKKALASIPTESLKVMVEALAAEAAERDLYRTVGSVIQPKRSMYDHYDCHD